MITNVIIDQMIIYHKVIVTTMTIAYRPLLCLFLHGFCSIFQHAERDTYRRLCWTTVFPTLVGTVKLVCTLCEFWWWKVQSECGYVWMVLFIAHFTTNTSRTTQPHKIPANNLRNAIFTMCVLAWILSCFPTCWKIHIQQIMLAKVFPRSVGTVKLVCFLCEFWWWKVQLEYG